jgi:hypothetical protein
MKMFFFYFSLQMSDVELGGGTAFINVGALVQPRKVTNINRVECPFEDN